jgi:phosphoserine phosphatase
MPGAKALIQTLRARGLPYRAGVGRLYPLCRAGCGKEIGFHKVVANVLDIACGALSGYGAVPIVDSARKKTELEQGLVQLALDPGQSIAIGDGANDIPMIEAAGLGVAYHAKEKTRAAADAEIRHGDLSALLYAAGIVRTGWVES